MIIGGMNMQRLFLAIVLIAGTWLAAFTSPVQAAPCLLVTLTGTMSGPVLLNGVAGAGTLVRYGGDSSECNAVKLQFDAGRGTALRLSQVDLDVGQLDAIFFTHMHSDHTDLCRSHAGALELELRGAKARRGLQRGCAITSRLHHELPQSCRPHRGCLHSVR
jgi:hypothetical protein